MNHHTLIVTGGSSGIGKSIVETVSELFQVVHFFGRNSKKLKKISKKLSPTCFVHEIDFSRSSEIKKMESIIKNIDTKISAFLHSAGAGLPISLQDLSISNSKTIMNINYYSFLSIAHNVLPIMMRNNFGRIVVIGSISERRSQAFMTNYAASKSALTSAAQCFAAETIKKNIAINIIAPGSVTTSLGIMGRKILAEKNLSDIESSYNKRLQNLPLNQQLEPKDINPIAYFLFSQDKPSLSGQVICVAGTTFMN